MKYASHSLEETQEIAKSFISSVKPNTNSALIVGLYGDLGAGKTSFTQGVAVTLGIPLSEVISPTFVIEKIYPLRNQIFSHLIHIDAYRLDKSDELLLLGWNDIISNPKHLILIEWPERVENILPSHIQIQIKNVSPNEREIEIV